MPHEICISHERRRVVSAHEMTRVFFRKRGDLPPAAPEKLLCRNQSPKKWGVDTICPTPLAIMSPMNAKIARRLDMFKRVVGFMSQFPILSLPRVAAVLAEIITIIRTLEAAARDQLRGEGNSCGAVDVRESIANELRASLKDVNRTARTLDIEQGGVRPTFRLPKSGSYPALIATAQNIITKARSMESAFLAAGMSATFLVELDSLIEKFQDATTKKHSGQRARIQATATLHERAQQGTIAATKLDACVRNHFRNQPEIIAAWAHARHIERNPARSREDRMSPSALPEQKAGLESGTTPAAHRSAPPSGKDHRSDAGEPASAGIRLIAGNQWCDPRSSANAPAAHTDVLPPCSDATRAIDSPASKR